MADQVARRRLVDLLATGRVAMVEAQAGSGKSTLLAAAADAHDGPAVHAKLGPVRAGPGQLRHRLRASLGRSGLNDLAAIVDGVHDADPIPALLASVVDHDESLVVLLDDIHHADDDLVAMIASLAAGWPAPHRLILAGRRLAGPLRDTGTGSDVVTIGAPDLRFRPAETEELLGSDVAGRLDAADITQLTDRCNGWAAAIVLAIARIRRAAQDSDTALDREVLGLLSEPTTLPTLLEPLLSSATPAMRHAAAQAAALPGFDDTLLEAAGLDGGTAALADLGLPLEAAHAGLWCFPDAVRDVLAADAPDEHLTRLAAQRYLDVAWTGAALLVLEATGLVQDLAKLLATLPPSQVAHLDPAEHAAAVGVIPPELLASHPRILVHLADGYIVSGDLEEYRNTLGRARALVDARGDTAHDAEALEVIAADVTMRVVATDDDSLVAEAEAMLEDPGLPTLARARLLGAIGRATASRRTVAALRDGGRRLQEAIQTFQREGAVIHATAMRVIAANVAAWPLGRYDAALEQLDRALASARGNPRLRVAILPYQAFILIEVGRYAEAEAALTELRRTASTVGMIGNERSAAFARWGAAKLAAQRGDAEATWAACTAVERSDVVVDTGHGAFFRADAAQLLARVGRLDEAERMIADARSRDTGATSLVAVGELTVAAYAGDLGRFEDLLAELDDGQAAEPRERWRVTLLHAYVCQVNGDPRAEPLAAAAFEAAAQLGRPDLPAVREPAIAHLLLPLAQRGSASARDAAEQRGARIRVLGGFDVEVAGTITEPAGRPAELLAFLALHDRQTTSDQVIEALWPDSDPHRGRERLRTVLRRTRRDLGDLVERHDDLLRLSAGVTVDATEFADLVRRARGTDPVTREAAAAAALALYRGDAVPSLGYVDWIMAARQQLRRQALAMHDVLASIAEDDGQLDDALRALLRALELDPAVEDRYLTAARLLAEQGRRSRALALLGDARAALARAELTPSAELGRLERYLERDPALSTETS